MDRPYVQHSTDVAVIGAGPAGFALALTLARRGYRVALLESGLDGFSADHQKLGNAESLDPRRHASMDLCTRRQVGGASNTWGGRLVPYDPIDFAPRSFVPSAIWPVSYEQMKPFFQRACDMFFGGRAAFNTGDIEEISEKTIVPDLPDGDVRSSDLERWSLPTNFRREFCWEAESLENLIVLRGYSCVAMRTDKNGQRIVEAECRSLTGERMAIEARFFVLACGSLETTRLLLNFVERGELQLGPSEQWLGNGYMGHVSGRIASVRFSTPPDRTVYGFLRDRDGVYVRPRFTFSPECQQREQILNTALWLVNPPIGDAGHGNGVLSFAYLALRSPLGKYFAPEAIRQSALKNSENSTVGAHVWNMIRDLPKTAAFVPSFGVRRFLMRRKAPGFFQRSADNRYDLHYHAEQIPNQNSCVRLGGTTDAVGLRRIKIDLQFQQQDIDSVVRCHELLDAHLQRHRVGKLEYAFDDLHAAVWDQAADGYHQAGTTRMAERAEDGVVDSHCRVFGTSNLYVASGSTFVTSGQANTTFMIVAFALRIADKLAQELEGVRPAACGTSG